MLVWETGKALEQMVTVKKTKVKKNKYFWKHLNMSNMEFQLGKNVYSPTRWSVAAGYLQL